MKVNSPLTMARAALEWVEAAARRFRYRYFLGGAILLSWPGALLMLIGAYLNFDWKILAGFAGVALLVSFLQLRGDAHGNVPWKKIETQGVWCIGAGFLVAGVMLGARIAGTTDYLILGIYTLLSLVCLIAIRRSQAQTAVALRTLSALLVIPFLVAWIVFSLVHSGYHTFTASRVASRINETDLQKTLSARKAHLDRWNAAGGPVIALTLSGGGYHAAMGHAGLLWAFDQAGIPVHYLSTVSGGSIIGAAYASGWEPVLFKDLLKSGRPGLASDMLHIWNFTMALVSPSAGTGYVYARHLQRVYFSDKTYDAVGPPVLIVNTTDLMTDTRHVFWSMSPPQSSGASGSAPPPARPSLATVVAASGAFPIFFDPLEIDRGLHTDGGVLENMGILGLMAYSRQWKHRTKSAAPTPDLVIVSNFGAWTKRLKRGGRLAVGMHAQDVIYANMHDLMVGSITRGVTNSQRAAGGGPSFIPLEHVWDAGEPTGKQDPLFFMLKPNPFDVLTRYQTCTGLATCNDEIRERALDLAYGVGQLDTLAELSADEVEAAFWVGAKLGHSYVEDLCAAIGARRHKASGAAGLRCGTFVLPDPPPVSRRLHRLADRARNAR